MAGPCGQRQGQGLDRTSRPPVGRRPDHPGQHEADLEAVLPHPARRGRRTVRAIDLLDPAVDVPADPVEERGPCGGLRQTRLLLRPRLVLAVGLPDPARRRRRAAGTNRTAQAGAHRRRALRPAVEASTALPADAGGSDHRTWIGRRTRCPRRGEGPVAGRADGGHQYRRPGPADRSPGDCRARPAGGRPHRRDHGGPGQP